MARNNLVICIAGNRGRGKTDFCKNLIRRQREKRLQNPNEISFQKTVVVDTFDSAPWRTMKTFDHPEGVNEVIHRLPIGKLPYLKDGVWRLFGSNTAEIQKMIERYLLDAFVIYEDATKYIGSKLTEDFKKFVYDTKQKGIDIVFVFHSITAIPRDLIRCSDGLFLFKTGEQFSQVKNKVGHVPGIEEAMQRLNESDNRYAVEELILN